MLLGEWLSREHLLDNASACRQELADFRRILATGFSEVWPASAATTDDGRELLHNLPGWRLLREIGCDSHDDGDLSIRRGRDDDHAALDLSAVLIDECA